MWIDQIHPNRINIKFNKQKWNLLWWTLIANKSFGKGNRLTYKEIAIKSINRNVKVN